MKRNFTHNSRYSLPLSNDHVYHSNMLVTSVIQNFVSRTFFHSTETCDYIYRCDYKNDFVYVSKIFSYNHIGERFGTYQRSLIITYSYHRLKGTMKIIWKVYLSMFSYTTIVYHIKSTSQLRRFDCPFPAIEESGPIFCTYYTHIQQGWDRL